MKILPYSLYVRLVLLGAMGTLVSVCALGGYIAYKQGKQATLLALQQSNTISTAIANALAPDLLTKNYAGIERTVSQASFNEDIIRLQVININGNIIVESTSVSSSQKIKHGGLVDLSGHDKAEFTVKNDYIEAWVPIVAGNTLGWVYSALSLKKISTAQRHILLDTGLIALLSVMSALLIMALALRKTIRQITIVTRFASTIYQKHDKLLELNPNSAEVAQLVSALNSAAKKLNDQNIELVELNKNFIQLLENTSDYIYYKNREDQILFCSQTFAIVTGHKSWRELIGKQNIDFLSQESPNLHLQEESSIFENGIPIINRVSNYFNEHGKPGWISSSKWPVFSDNGHDVIGVFGITRDVTDQINIQTQLRESRDIAEKSTKIKSEFLANMSHEIRTPMNGILGLTDLVLKQDISPVVRNYLEKILSSSRTLLLILNDILDFSKLESGHLSIENTSFKLDTIIENLLNIFDHLAYTKSIKLNFDIADDIPLYLIGDPLRIQQILSNLLGNALKFTEKGHVTLKVLMTEQKNSAVMLKFSVEDTGIGIADDDLDKLFKAFSQVDGSITRRFGGTGLGLAISQNLLMLMGSKFQVTSQLHKGSIFSFELLLPISIQNNEMELVLKSHNSASSLQNSLDNLNSNFIGCKVLVVEDNRINQIVISQYLELLGIEVMLANNGQEALDCLSQNDCDAILMDVHMPTMNGIEATTKIRSISEIAQLPIIALTAGVTMEEREKCSTCGMNSFLTKPINPDELFDTLAHYLKLSNSATQKINSEDAQRSKPDSEFTSNNIDQSEKLFESINEIEALLIENSFISIATLIRLKDILPGNQMNTFNCLEKQITDIQYEQALLTLSKMKNDLRFFDVD